MTWKIKPPTGPEETVESKYEFDGTHESEPLYGIKLKLEHTFEKAGTYEITDVVHTDDLADEVSEPAVKDKLVVTGGTAGKLSVKMAVPSPSSVFAHEEEAKLAAKVEVSGETTLHVKKVTWEFGDGSPRLEEGAKEVSDPAELEAKHKFARCGTGESTKCTIKLTVEVEKAGEPDQTETGKVEITVKENAAERAQREKTEEETRQKEKEAEAEKAAAAAREAAAAAAKVKAAEEAAAAQKAAEEAAKRKAEEEARAKAGVAGYVASFAGSSLSVSPSGAVSVTISCPSGGSCNGKLTLQTLNAVAAKSKKKILVLGQASFSLSGGSRSMTIHLSSAGKTLLHKAHGSLKAKLAILSNGSGGQKTNTAAHVVTLHLKKH